MERERVSREVLPERSSPALCLLRAGESPLRWLTAVARQAMSRRRNETRRDMEVGTLGVAASLASLSPSSLPSAVLGVGL